MALQAPTMRKLEVEDNPALNIRLVGANGSRPHYSALGFVEPPWRMLAATSSRPSTRHHEEPMVHVEGRPSGSECPTHLMSRLPPRHCRL